jgi:hypothetical protein
VRAIAGLDPYPAGIPQEPRCWHLEPPPGLSALVSLPDFDVDAVGDGDDLSYSRSSAALGSPPPAAPSMLRVRVRIPAYLVPPAWIVSRAGGAFASRRKRKALRGVAP